MVLDFWSNAKGYVVIIVEGEHVERFVNMAIRRDIYIWNITTIGEKKLKMNVSIKGFKELAAVAYKTNCSMKIIKKKGVPFVIARYKKRKAFIIGIALFLMFFAYLNSFIWDMQIKGLKNVKESYVVSVLKKNGIRIGMLKYGVDCKNIQSNIMDDVNGIVWIGISIKGTTVYVDVKESTPEPKVVDQTKPCNIVAKKNGLIEKVITRNGRDQIVKGDAVIKNQLLVSGIIESSGVSEGTVRYVHSDSQVFARTWYESSVKVNYINKKLIDTGKKENQYSIIIFNKQIPLYINKNSYKIRKENINIKKLHLGRNTYLPFGIIDREYDERKYKTETLSNTEAKEKLAKEIKKKIKELIPEKSKITDKKVTILSTRSGIVGKIVVECIEDIGQERPIKVSEQ